MPQSPRPEAAAHPLSSRSSVLDKVPPALRHEVDRALIDHDPPTYKAVFSKFGLADRNVSFTAFYYYARHVRYQATLLDRARIVAGHSVPRASPCPCRRAILTLPQSDAADRTMHNASRKPLPDHPDEVRMSFGEHLEDLRWRLIKALIGLAIGTSICIYFGSEILGFLTTPLYEALEANGYPPEMINIDPTETFMRYFHTALVFGLGLSAPYALYQLWQFVAAGLYPHERRWVTLFAPASMILFFTGVIFLVKVVLPITMTFLVWTAEWIPTPDVKLKPRYATTRPASDPARFPILRSPPEHPADGMIWINEPDGSLGFVIGGKVLRIKGTEAASDHLVRPMYGVQAYLEFVNGMCLAFGCGFQIPIVIVILVLARIVTTARLAGLRKIIILLIVSAGAILTPSGDVTSQLLLAVPMFVLFELGLFIAKRIERQRTTAAPRA